MSRTQAQAASATRWLEIAVPSGCGAAYWAEPATEASADTAVFRLTPPAENATSPCPLSTLPAGAGGWSTPTGVLAEGVPSAGIPPPAGVRWLSYQVNSALGGGTDPTPRPQPGLQDFHLRRHLLEESLFHRTHEPCLPAQSSPCPASSLASCWRRRGSHDVLGRTPSFRACALPVLTRVHDNKALVVFSALRCTHPPAQDHMLTCRCGPGLRTAEGGQQCSWRMGTRWLATPQTPTLPEVGCSVQCETPPLPTLTLRSTRFATRSC